MNIFRRLKSGIRRLITPPTRVKLVPVEVPVFHNALLKGRRALITGGGSGIGLAIAEACGRSGASVVLAGRTVSRLEDASHNLERLGVEVSVADLDVCDVASFAGKLDKIGDFDILVNNAGFVGGGAFGTTSEVDYNRVLETNLRGVYFLSQEVSSRWIKNKVKGNILNICSASSLRPGESPYILSKWGLRALTIGMARRLVKHGIVVNGLAPGCTNTDQFSRDGDLTNGRNPSGRLVTTTEIGNMAVVMVSSLTRMVVGDVLFVTGGGAITTLDD